MAALPKTKHTHSTNVQPSRSTNIQASASSFPQPSTLQGPSTSHTVEHASQQSSAFLIGRVESRAPATVTEENGKSDFELLDHYKNVVCHLLMPTVDLERNPWLHAYFGMAAADTCTTTSQLALREALISVAAYHLVHTDPVTNEQYHQRAEENRIMAFDHIQSVLAGQPAEIPPLDKHALLAGSMTLISTDVFRTDQSDCKLNLNLARRVIRLTGGVSFWKSTGLSNALWQIFCAYDLIACTADATNTDSDHTRRSQEDVTAVQVYHSADDSPAAEEVIREPSVIEASEELCSEGPYILDLTFGVAERTFSLLEQTIRLSKSCSRYGRHSASWPLDVKTSVDDLWERMLIPPRFSTSIRSDLLRDYLNHTSSIGFAKPILPLPPIVGEEVIENHQRSFHFAVLLFFHRTFHSMYCTASRQGKTTSSLSSRTGIKEAECQNYVRRILDCVENIESLTRDMPTQAANTLWPGFIAAVEAVDIDLRHRALIWLSKASLRGLGNVSRSKEVVMETWRQVDRFWTSSNDPLTAPCGLGPVDWREIMKQDSTIMLT